MRREPQIGGDRTPETKETPQPKTKNRPVNEDSLIKIKMGGHYDALKSAALALGRAVGKRARVATSSMEKSSGKDVSFSSFPSSSSSSSFSVLNTAEVSEAEEMNEGWNEGGDFTDSNLSDSEEDPCERLCGALLDPAAAFEPPSFFAGSRPTPLCFWRSPSSPDLKASERGLSSTPPAPVSPDSRSAPRSPARPTCAAGGGRRLGACLRGANEAGRAGGDEEPHEARPRENDAPAPQAPITLEPGRFLPVARPVAKAWAADAQPLPHPLPAWRVQETQSATCAALARVPLGEADALSPRRGAGRSLRAGRKRPGRIPAPFSQPRDRPTVATTYLEATACSRSPSPFVQICSSSLAENEDASFIDVLGRSINDLELCMAEPSGCGIDLLEPADSSLLADIDAKIFGFGLGGERESSRPRSQSMDSEDWSIEPSGSLEVTPDFEAFFISDLLNAPEVEPMERR